MKREVMQNNESVLSDLILLGLIYDPCFQA